MPIPLLAVASLIGQIPSLFRIFGDNAPPPPIVDKIASIAQSITGESDPEKAAEILHANPDKMLEFKNAAENRAVEIIQIYLADTQNARARDTEIQKIRGKNTRADALVVACVAGIATCVLLAVFKSDLSEFAQTLLNVSLGAFLGTWAQVNNFEFGSTKDSKEKSQAIVNLTQTGNNG